MDYKEDIRLTKKVFQGQMVMESDSKTQQAGHPDSRKNSEPRGSKPFLEKLGI